MRVRVSSKSVNNQEARECSSVIVLLLSSASMRVTMTTPKKKDAIDIIELELKVEGRRTND